MTLVICDGYGQFKWFCDLTDKTGEFRYISYAEKLAGWPQSTPVVLYGPLRSREALRSSRAARDRFHTVERIYEYEDHCND